MVIDETPDWGDERRREITWHDPTVGAAEGRGLSGMDYLTAMLEGRLPPPPIAQTLGFTLTRIDAGEVWFSCPPDESHYNPIGMVHGGLVCTLLDSALACAAHTLLPAGTAYTSVEIKVSYLRPVSPAGGTLTAHGWVAKPGRRVMFVEGDVRDAADRVVATASGTCLVIEAPVTELSGRAPRSAVTGSAVSRSFVAVGNDEERVAPDRSCTPERLRP